MPEQFSGENAGRVEALTSADPLEAKVQGFRIFAYQLSNNLTEHEPGEYRGGYDKYTKTVKIFRDIDLPRPVWKDLVFKSLEQPTDRAITEALFTAALNTGTLDICERWGELARPIQLAMNFLIRNLDLARLLIRFGADVDLVTEDDPKPALHRAAKECTVEAVRVLVEAGASIVHAIWKKDCLTPDTALTNAVDANWDHVRGGAKKDEFDKSGWVRQTLSYLLTLYDREQHHHIIQGGLIRAASKDRRDIVMDLIQAGAVVNEASSQGYTPLIAAAASSYEGSYARMVKVLLDLGADVDGAFRQSGICPIHVAAAKNDEKLIRLLIDHGADVNALASHEANKGRSLLGSHFDRKGMAADTFCEMKACQRPLQFALFSNKALKFKLYNFEDCRKGGRVALALIRAGATLDGRELARAGRLRDGNLLRELLSLGADVNEVDGAGRSALQACLEHGNLNQVGSLLESGATVRKGQLVFAAKAGRHDLVEKLLNYGAVPDDRDAGYSVLEAAASNGNWELMMWLVEAHDVPYDEGALCAAICSGLGSRKANGKYLLSLLKRRSKDATAGFLETTAVGYAAIQRQGWVLQHLLQLKINGSCVMPVGNDNGYDDLFKSNCGRIRWAYDKPFWRDPAMIRCSVLVPALHANDWRTVCQLLRRGHQPDRLSLLVTIEGQSLKAIVSLTTRMDNLDICQPAWTDLDTPLQAAVRHRRVDVAQHLLSLCANVNAPASRRFIDRFDWRKLLLPRTVLQAAVENCHLEMMNLLLDAMADVNGPPGQDSGATALQIVAGRGHIGMARQLLGLGADVNAEGAILSGRTALEAAAEGGRWTWCSFCWRRVQGRAVV